MLQAINDHRSIQFAVLFLMACVACCLCIFVFPVSQAQASISLLAGISPITIVIAILVACGIIFLSDEDAQEWGRAVWEDLSTTVKDYITYMSESLQDGSLGLDSCFQLPEWVYADVAGVAFETIVANGLTTGITDVNTNYFCLDGIPITHCSGSVWASVYTTSYYDDLYSVGAISIASIAPVSWIGQGMTFDWYPFSSCPDFALRFTKLNNAVLDFSVSAISVLCCGEVIKSIESWRGLSDVSFIAYYSDIYDVGLGVFSKDLSNRKHLPIFDSNSLYFDDSGNFILAPLLVTFQEVIDNTYTSGTANPTTTTDYVTETPASSTTWTDNSVAYRGDSFYPLDLTGLADTATETGVIGGILAAGQAVLQGTTYREAIEAAGGSYADMAATDAATTSEAVEAAQQNANNQNNQNENNSNTSFFRLLVAAIVAFLAMLGGEVIDAGNDLRDQSRGFTAFLSSLYNALPSMIRTLIFFTFACIVLSAVIRRFLG